MFYHQQLLSETGKLSLISIAGHFQERKLSKKRILESDLEQICEDLAQHNKLFALPVRATLVLGSAKVCRKKLEYLKRDVQDLEKRMAKRTKSLEVQIKMREVPEHRKSKMVIERSKFPSLKLTADLLDIDFGLLGQPAPEIDDQPAPEIGDQPAPKIGDQHTTDEFFEPWQEDATNANFNLPPTGHSFEEAEQEPAVAETTPAVLAIPRAPFVVGRLRRKKIKVDTHTKITSEELGKRLGNPRIATRKREDVLPNWAMIERNKVESRFREIGRGLLGKGLKFIKNQLGKGLKFIKNQKRDFDRHNEDPFAWVDSGREPARMAVERPGTEQGRAENGEPVAKRPRAELTEAQLPDRYNLCGAFMEQRYQQKAKRGVASFADLMDGNNRKKTEALCLYSILKKASDGIITVEQSEPYGPILIKKTNPELSLEG